MDHFEVEQFWAALNRLYEATDKLHTAAEALKDIAEAHESRLDKIEVVQQWLAEKERAREKRNES